jgi:hypothetical protein
MHAEPGRDGHAAQAAQGFEGLARDGLGRTRLVKSALSTTTGSSEVVDSSVAAASARSRPRPAIATRAPPPASARRRGHAHAG